MYHNENSNREFKTKNEYLQNHNNMSQNRSIESGRDKQDSNMFSCICGRWSRAILGTGLSFKQDHIVFIQQAARLELFEFNLLLFTFRNYIQKNKQIRI